MIVVVVNLCSESYLIEKGMHLIGGDWKESMIYHLKDGPMRFNASGSNVVWRQ